MGKGICSKIVTFLELKMKVVPKLKLRYVFEDGIVETGIERYFSKANMTWPI